MAYSATGAHLSLSCWRFSSFLVQLVQLQQLLVTQQLKVFGRKALSNTNTPRLEHQMIRKLLQLASAVHQEVLTLAQG
jgi:hypothetical protein